MNNGAEDEEGDGADTIVSIVSAGDGAKVAMFVFLVVLKRHFRR